MCTFQGFVLYVNMYTYHKLDFKYNYVSPLGMQPNANFIRVNYKSSSWEICHYTMYGRLKPLVQFNYL